jgi:4-hydroxybutyrate CoA-transferase
MNGLMTIQRGILSGDYINNSHVIAQNDKVFSVNSALQADLMGQVCAETIKGKQFSGIGGQMDS